MAVGQAIDTHALREVLWLSGSSRGIGIWIKKPAHV